MKLLESTAVVLIYILILFSFTTAKKNELEDFMQMKLNNKNTINNKEEEKGRDDDSFLLKSYDYTNSKSEVVNLFEKNQKLKIQKPSTNNKIQNSKSDVPQAKIIPQKNPYFPKSISQISYFTRASNCKYKSGFLYLVKNPEKLRDQPLSINTVPVFVSMNLNTIDIQMGVSPRTLFHTFKVQNILRITKKFKNANCFEIVENQIIEKKIAKSPVVLCSNAFQSFIKWVKTIQEFKNCLYDVDSRIDGDKTLVDFHKVNEVTPLSNKKDNEILKPLYYAGTPLKNKNKTTQYEMQKQLTKIVGLLERGTNNNQKMNRKMNDKLNKAIIIENDLKLKKHMLEDIMDKRRIKEKEKMDQMKSKIAKKREIQLLKAVKERINQYKVILNKLFKNKI
jgi:hypothetical protein